jgi:hypothetical protein
MPIACTLGPAQMEQRGEDIRALGQAALLDAVVGERHATLRFRPGPDIRRRVKAIVTAESDCCAFLDFALTVDGADATLLKIEAPEGGEAIVRELAYLFAARATVNPAVCTCQSCLNSRKSR